MPAWLENLFNLLLEGKILEMTYNLYSSILGNQVFMGMIITVTAAAAYLRGGSLAMGAVYLLSGVVLAVLMPPELHMLASIAILVGIASLMFTVLTGR